MVTILRIWNSESKKCVEVSGAHGTVWLAYVVLLCVLPFPLFPSAFVRLSVCLLRSFSCLRFSLPTCYCTQTQTQTYVCNVCNWIWNYTVIFFALSLHWIFLLLKFHVFVFVCHCLLFFCCKSPAHISACLLLPTHIQICISQKQSEMKINNDFIVKIPILKKSRFRKY